MAGRQGSMSPATARRLAALIVADAEQLQERAGDHGVTAFVGRPLQRERPNERFLQSTIRNLASANRRKDERAMWAAREAEQQQQQERQRQGGRASGQRQRHRDDGGDDGSGGRRHGRSRSRSRDRSRSRRRSRSPGGQRSRRRGRSSSSRHERSSLSKWRHSTDRSSSRSWSEVPQDEPAGPDSASTAAAAAAAAGGGARSAPGAASRSGDGTPSCEDSSNDADDDVAQPDHAAALDAEKDEQLVQWLASSREVRGRGSIGPRADLPGPFLQAPDDPQHLQQAVTKGPERPAWLPQQEPSARLAPDAGFLRGVLRAQGISHAAAAAEDKPDIRQHDKQRRKKKRRRASSSGSESSHSTGSSSDGGSRKRRSSGGKQKKEKRKKKKKKEKRSKHKKQHTKAA